MRVKLSGQITAERLAEALQKTAEKFGDNLGGFYGGNLYLNAFNKDGEPMEIVDHRGKEIGLSFGVPDGEIFRPALSEAAKVRKAERAEEKNQQEEAWLKRQEQQQREFDERRRVAREKEALEQALNKQTTCFIQEDAAGFLNAMNEIIHGVWAEMNPICPSGKDKGNPRPLPWFEVVDGVLLLHRNATGKSYFKVGNPVAKLQYGELEPHWKNEAWRKVAGGIQELMIGMAEKAETRAS